jgi:hypothetical protein
MSHEKRLVVLSEPSSSTLSIWNLTSAPKRMSLGQSQNFGLSPPKTANYSLFGADNAALAQRGYAHATS